MEILLLQHSDQLFIHLHKILWCIVGHKMRGHYSCKISVVQAELKNKGSLLWYPGHEFLQESMTLWETILHLYT